MNILKISREQLPCWVVEARSSKTGVWSRFTDEPFSNADAACAHIDKVLATYTVFKRESLRVVEYDYKLWQSDLINLILKDNDAVRRALSVLRPETLTDALKG